MKKGLASILACLSCFSSEALAKGSNNVKIKSRGGVSSVHSRRSFSVPYGPVKLNRERNNMLTSKKVLTMASTDRKGFPLGYFLGVGIPSTFVIVGGTCLYVRHSNKKSKAKNESDGNKNKTLKKTKGNLSEDKPNSIDEAVNRIEKCRCWEFKTFDDKSALLHPRGKDNWFKSVLARFRIYDGKLRVRVCTYGLGVSLSINNGASEENEDISSMENNYDIGSVENNYDISGKDKDFVLNMLCTNLARWLGNDIDSTDQESFSKLSNAIKASLTKVGLNKSISNWLLSDEAKIGGLLDGGH